MQTPPQSISAPGHDTAHTPSAQTFPFVQAAPALPPLTPQPLVAPQLARLVAGSMQLPPQSISVPGQDTAQAPWLQALPLMQTVPALPLPDTPQPTVAPQ